MGLTKPKIIVDAGVELPELTNPAGAGYILDGYEVVNGSGELLTGSMVNNGAVSAELVAGAVYAVPVGYHDGTGSVSAKSLASQTAGTATAADILSGATAWVDGTQVTGEHVCESEYEYIEAAKKTTSVSSWSFVSSLDSVSAAMGTQSGTAPSSGYSMIGFDNARIYWTDGSGNWTYSNIGAASYECKMSFNGGTVTLTAPNPYYQAPLKVLCVK